MSREPWYAFMDGPRDQAGNLMQWPSAWAALLWALFTFIVVVVCLGAVVLVLLTSRQSLGAFGFAALLLVAIGPLIVASLISWVRTTINLLKMLAGHSSRTVRR